MRVRVHVLAPCMHTCSPICSLTCSPIYNKVVALIAETFVFVYLGMALVTFPIFDHTVWLLVGVSLLA